MKSLINPAVDPKVPKLYCSVKRLYCTSYTAFIWLLRVGGERTYGPTRCTEKSLTASGRRNWESDREYIYHQKLKWWRKREKEQSSHFLQQASCWNRKSEQNKYCLAYSDVGTKHCNSNFRISDCFCFFNLNFKSPQIYSIVLSTFHDPRRTHVTHSDPNVPLQKWMGVNLKQWPFS